MSMDCPMPIYSHFFNDGGLAPIACIVVEENVKATDDFCIDDGDSSVTRSLKVRKSSLGAAG